jgi:tight adherence protein B
MALLPLGLGAVLYGMQPEAMRAVIETPIGWAGIAVVALLEISGWLLIRRIVAIRI